MRPPHVHDVQWLVRRQLQAPQGSLHISTIRYINTQTIFTIIISRSNHIGYNAGQSISGQLVLVFSSETHSLYCAIS